MEYKDKIELKDTNQRLSEELKRLRAENEVLKNTLHSYKTELLRRKESLLDMQKQKEVADRKINELNEKHAYMKQFWKTIQSQNILERQQRYQYYTICNKSERQHNDELNFKNYTEVMKTEILQLKEKLKQAEERELVLGQDLKLAYGSLEIEREEFDKKERRLLESLGEKEKNLRQTNVLLAEQQRVMGEIKHMSRVSFSKVNRSHTLDTVENYKKEIENAYSIHKEEKDKKLRYLKPPNATRDSTDRSSEDSLCTQINPVFGEKEGNYCMKKNSQCIIKANHVHINSKSNVFNRTENIYEELDAIKEGACKD